MQNTHIKRTAIVGVAVLLAGLLVMGTHLMASSSPASKPVVKPDAPAATFWTSGWQAINQNQTRTFSHNLSMPPEQLAVEVWFRDTDTGGIGINRASYGGAEVSGAWHGAYWHHLTANSVQVRRMANDTVADQINVKVWVAPTPDYDSGWRTVTTDTATSFDHHLGITATELNVSVWFSSTALGIHHLAYGGLTNGASEQGAYWMRLTNNSVEVYRRPNDVNVEQARVVVTHGAPPAYDSLIHLGGWRSVTPGSLVTFTHNLNAAPEALLVRAECRDTTPGGAGIHQLWAGGDHWTGGFRGGHVQRLTANTVEFVRRPNDVECDQVRVVIYERGAGALLYLPLVMNNYAQEIELAYDDGAAESDQSWATLESGFAVQFTSPGAFRLVRARYYLNTAASNHPIQVHVWDASHVDLVTPFTATPPAGAGWFDVDLSSQNLTVTGDFYVGFLYTAQHSDPSLGVDTSAPDGRSYEVPWQQMGNDYMIRAVIAP